MPCNDEHVRAMTVVPGRRGSARVEEVPDPQGGSLLVRGLLVGVCGTDREIAEGAYGTPPADDEKLIVGHESRGEVLAAPTGSGFARGDLVGIMNLDPTFEVDATALNCNMALRNQVLFGTVNAGRHHREQAAAALAAADPGWLRGMIGRRVPLARWTEALDRQPEDIKVVVDLSA
jgi:D-arabinose 1-dehydrogenase-like Zn-dependent alcohol dehydrogenase